ncbi:DUF695 domain-containing protein [Flavobacterium humi]|uniref:DUF695 domain-containing protein n=1 Tax=Flavobacterium humi TaxID=2562683 RepID=A0A4Z0L602_9FLAO|nr:DUF695 domain-containing protein [Flavobacterium humi]TGD56532.1 DUF695 domain-containing protein [Flavobacterium humi]
MGIFDRFFNGESKNGSSDTITIIPQSWSILQGKNNGNPMLIRKNVGCDKIAGNKNYSISCGIAFKLLFPAENGFPDVESEPELNNLEDDIFDFFETDLNSIVPLVITTSGFKEYVLYTKDVNEFKIRLEKLKAKYKQYELTSYNESDKNWKTYKSFK